MANKDRRKPLGATELGPKPGEFPLGSEKSRAAARAVLEAREVEPQGNQLLLVLTAAALELALDSQTCVEILRECRFLPVGPCGGVDLCHIPDGLSAKELEQYLREHGASLCSPQNPR